MIRYFLIAALLVLLLFFVGLNLDNRATVTVLFLTFQNVPVFFVAMIGYVLGFGSALPLFLRARGSDKSTRPKGSSTRAAPQGSEDSSS